MSQNPRWRSFLSSTVTVQSGDLPWSRAWSTVPNVVGMAETRLQRIRNHCKLNSRYHHRAAQPTVPPVRSSARTPWRCFANVDSAVNLVISFGPRHGRPCLMWYGRPQLRLPSPLRSLKVGADHRPVQPSPSKPIRSSARIRGWGASLIVDSCSKSGDFPWS